MDVASDPISVLLADDHPLVLSALGGALTRDGRFSVVAQAGDGEAALDAIRAHRPAVAVLDQSMPGMTGTQILAAAAGEGLATKVVILSAGADSQLVYSAIAAGARGFLTKDGQPRELCEAIAQIDGGDVVLSSSAQLALADGVRRREQTGHTVLTPRELEVLHQIAAGRSAPDIAAGLGLSTATIKSHLGTLYEKLEVSDRAAAVAAAMRNGLLR
ncbi:MAG: two component transcriptional regulator, LuxR family [Solirubrobacterales bacterium]|nr:two component transcriptional regulator, LuxR family [Solirubrobacterales bacterium]